MRDDEVESEQRQKLPYPRMRVFVTVLYLVVAAIWVGLAFSWKGEAQIWSFVAAAIFLSLAVINLFSTRKSLRRNGGPGLDVGHR
jgi:membrane protein YdbS with pleckstrin-like domain